MKRQKQQAVIIGPFRHFARARDFIAVWLQRKSPTRNDLLNWGERGEKEDRTINSAAAFCEIANTYEKAHDFMT